MQLIRLCFALRASRDGVLAASSGGSFQCDGAGAIVETEKDGVGYFAER